jgi:hypothetical protein
VDSSIIADYNQNIDPLILDEEPNGVAAHNRTGIILFVEKLSYQLIRAF